MSQQELVPSFTEEPPSTPTDPKLASALEQSRALKEITQNGHASLINKELFPDISTEELALSRTIVEMGQLNLFVQLGESELITPERFSNVPEEPREHAVYLAATTRAMQLQQETITPPGNQNMDLLRSLHHAYNETLTARDDRRIKYLQERHGEPDKNLGAPPWITQQPTRALPQGSMPDLGQQQRNGTGQYL